MASRSRALRPGGTRRTFFPGADRRPWPGSSPAPGASSWPPRSTARCDGTRRPGPCGRRQPCPPTPTIGFGPPCKPYALSTSVPFEFARSGSPDLQLGLHLERRKDSRRPDAPPGGSRRPKASRRSPSGPLPAESRSRLAAAATPGETARRRRADWAKTAPAPARASAVGRSRSRRRSCRSGRRRRRWARPRRSARCRRCRWASSPDESLLGASQTTFCGVKGSSAQDRSRHNDPNIEHKPTCELSFVSTLSESPYLPLSWR